MSTRGRWVVKKDPNIVKVFKERPLEESQSDWCYLGRAHSSWKRALSVRLLLFSLSPTCSTCINRAQMNLVWSDGQCTVIWFLVFCSKHLSIKMLPVQVQTFYVKIIKWTVHGDLISDILFIISVNQNITRSSSNHLFLGTMCDCLDEDAQNHQKNKAPNESLILLLSISFQIITEVLYAYEVFSFIQISV